jgi:hypothetical protein
MASAWTVQRAKLLLCRPQYTNLTGACQTIQTLNSFILESMNHLLSMPKTLQTETFCCEWNQVQVDLKYQMS